MELYHILTSIINGLFIREFFIGILSIIIAARIFKTDIRDALEIIRWIMIIYAVLNIYELFAAWYSGTEMLFYSGKPLGRYWFVYYLQVVPNTILPLLLLIKKLRRNKYILLALAFLMNISWWLEWATMYNDDMFHQHGPDHGSNNYLWFMFLKGFLIGGVIYAIGNAITRAKSRKLNAK